MLVVNRIIPATPRASSSQRVWITRSVYGKATTWQGQIREAHARMDNPAHCAIKHPIVWNRRDWLIPFVGVTARSGSRQQRSASRASRVHSAAKHPTVLSKTDWRHRIPSVVRIGANSEYSLQLYIIISCFWFCCIKSAITRHTKPLIQQYIFSLLALYRGKKG